ncbi:hypothetical protein PTE_00951 [Photorhabdus khanii NC19]|uniref:Uncharacterized protein n=1 Tax=Photorhabdus khanii NC19 TaxID=1004151 RepID=W3VCK7_9GAMM|nr:hypothetical protein PTE_00951 [Photorhabdus khanii NC19]
MNSWGNQQLLHAVLSTVISFSLCIFKEKKMAIKVHNPLPSLETQITTKVYL